ncbi:hypothetical protein BDZ89DRAFT_1135489 [Hymenopellis radicata]|nr:hypothetical protein BDZ89DRAFT_1135489 [Hymenopellis radicata]
MSKEALITIRRLPDRAPGILNVARNDDDEPGAAKKPPVWEADGPSSCAQPSSSAHPILNPLPPVPSDTVPSFAAPAILADSDTRELKPTRTPIEWQHSLETAGAVNEKSRHSVAHEDEEQVPGLNFHQRAPTPTNSFNPSTRQARTTYHLIPNLSLSPPYVDPTKITLPMRCLHADININPNMKLRLGFVLSYHQHRQPIRSRRLAAPTAIDTDDTAAV